MKTSTTSLLALYGAKFVIFPNPTDGHWVRAIFGEHEPPAPATTANWAIWDKAAQKHRWEPK